jgi:hypothetical protein
MQSVATVTRPKVFLTSSLTDVAIAERVAKTLAASGVEASKVRGKSTARPEVFLRNLIRDSSATVVVMSKSTTSGPIPASVIFEIGAASGARKPVFVVLEDFSHKLGFSVPDMQIFPISRVEEIGEALNRV